MKAILMSIQPKHLVNILNGKKTLEIRKSVPKDFKGWVYLYCTKAKPNLVLSVNMTSNELKYVLTNINGFHTSVNGKVVARFWLDEYEELKLVNTSYDWSQEMYDEDYNVTKEQLDNLCISYEELHNYLQGKTGYALHIKQLEIFDEPKSLGEFYRIIDYDLHEGLYKEPIYKTLTKAPQSYMYVEVEE